MSITLKDYSLIQTLDESIGERVHIWLRRRGLMQRDLAAVLGISPAAVSHKIAGRSSWSALDLVKASTLLQLPLGELISDEMIEIEQKKLVSGSSEPETNSSHLRESNSRPSHYELDTFAISLLFFSQYQSRFSDLVTAPALVTASASALATYVLGLVISFNHRRISTMLPAERAVLSNGQEEESPNRSALP